MEISFSWLVVPNPWTDWKQTLTEACNKPHYIRSEMIRVLEPNTLLGQTLRFVKKLLLWKISRYKIKLKQQVTSTLFLQNRRPTYFQSMHSHLSVYKQHGDTHKQQLMHRSRGWLHKEDHWLTLVHIWFVPSLGYAWMTRGDTTSLRCPDQNTESPATDVVPAHCK